MLPKFDWLPWKIWHDRTKMKPVIGHHCKEHQSFSCSFESCDTVLHVNKTECSDLQII